MWAFKITDRMDHLEGRMGTVEAGLAANTTELQRHRTILMAIANERRRANVNLRCR